MCSSAGISVVDGTSHCWKLLTSGFNLIMSAWEWRSFITASCVMYTGRGVIIVNTLRMMVRVAKSGWQGRGQNEVDYDGT